MHPAVAIPQVLACKTQDIGRQGRLILPWLGDIPYGVAGKPSALQMRRSE